MADKSHVFLKVLGFGDDPSLVTSRIGLSSTSAWRLGDPMPAHATATRNHSRWSFQSPLPLEAQVERHLETLLPLLEPHAARIRECATEFSVELCCAIYYEDFTPGIHLSAEILERITALGIPIDLDLYFLGDDSDPPETSNQAMERTPKAFGVAHLILVRPMKARVFTVTLAVGLLAIPAFAVPPQTFKTAAAEAAHHFGTPEGHAFAITFVRDVLKATYDAGQACKRSPRDAIHDIVFVISSSGRIEQTIAGGKTTYGRCLTDSLHLPERVSAPPGDHWAVQLRFVNGPRKVEGFDPPFIVLSLPGLEQR